MTTSTATAQITIVDNPQNVWTGTNSHKLIMSEAVTVSSNADVFILDVQTYANTNWSGVNLYLGSTLLTQAAGYCPATGTKLGTAIYYALNPPTGSLTLSGTFGSATAGIANYYTLANVDTTKAVTSGTAAAGTNPNVSLTLSNTTGSFASIDQVTLEAAGPSPDAGSYSATSGAAGMITSTWNANIFGSDGYVQGLAGTSNTFTASVDVGATANHAMCAAIFASLPVTGPPMWTAGNGNWSTGGNWSSGTAPNAAGATAVFSQSGATTAAIALDVPVTVGTLMIGSTADTTGTNTVSYTFSGANTLTLSDGTSGVQVLSGTEAIAANIAGSGSLVVNGPAELVLSGSNSYTGGTFVEAGTLIVDTSSAIPDGSSLTVGAGGTFIFDPSVSGAPAAATMKAVEAVPEPPTFLLAVVGAAVLCIWRRSVKTLLLIVLFLLPAVPAIAGEGGTGLMSPEPGSIALLGAAVLFGVPAWYIRHRRKQREGTQYPGSTKDEAA
jgi:autotransporter-associated beta strand protein